MTVAADVAAGASDQAIPRPVPFSVIAVAVARVALIVAMLVGVYAVLPVKSGPVAQGAAVWAGLVAVVVFGAAFVAQIRRILASDHPMVTGVEALVVVVASFLVCFSLVHVSLSASDPSAYSEPLDKNDAVYFTVTVLSTVGFGDITPDSTSARLLVTLQMLADLVLIAVTIRVIFGLARHVDRRRSTLQSDDDAAGAVASGSASATGASPN